MGMSVRQRLPQLGRELRPLSLAQRAERFQSVAQRPGFYERHGEPQSAGGDTRVEQWQDLGMLQTREGQDLTLEALGAQLLAGRDRKDLERNVTLVAPIERQKDHGGRALAKDLFDGVAVAELGRNPFGVGREHGEGDLVANLAQVGTGRLPLEAMRILLAVIREPPQIRTLLSLG